MNTVELTKIVNYAFNHLVQSKHINSNILFTTLERVAKESFKLGEMETKIDTIFELTDPVSNRSI